MKIRLLLLMLILASFCSESYSRDSLQVNQEFTEEEYQIALAYFIDSLESTFVYEETEVTLDGGIAKIALPSGFKYLNGKDSDMVLTDIFGNPPAEGEMKS